MRAAMLQRMRQVGSAMVPIRAVGAGFDCEQYGRPKRVSTSLACFDRGIFELGCEFESDGLVVLHGISFTAIAEGCNLHGQHCLIS